MLLYKYHYQGVDRLLILGSGNVHLFVLYVWNFDLTFLRNEKVGSQKCYYVLLSPTLLEWSWVSRAGIRFYSLYCSFYIIFQQYRAALLDFLLYWPRIGHNVDH